MNGMNNKLQSFIQGYLECFKHYDIKTLQKYYCLPCTLSTPDKLVLVTTNEKFEQEFLQIFTQLKQANTVEFRFSNISYTKVNNEFITLGGHWVFINDQQETFAEFFACYHLLKENDNIKIVNVISHEVENTVTFTEKLVLEQE